MIPRPLFLYGTLLDPRVLERQAQRAGLARRLRPARLDGWRRVALRGTPYPTLLRAPATEAATGGALLPLRDAAALARLAAYEGPGYALVPLRVRAARGRMVAARAWIAPPWRADARRPWPAPPCRAPRRPAQP